MLKTCFTLNPLRNAEDIASYKEGIEKGYYQAVEVFYPYQYPDREITYTKHLIELHDEFPNLEFVLHLPHGPNNSLNIPGIIRRFQEAIDWFVPLDGEKLTLHLGSTNRQLSRQESIDEIIPVLQAICDYASMYELTVMIENMPNESELGTSVKEIAQIIDQANRSNLKFILDTGHAYVYGVNPSEFIYSLSKVLCHLHISDNMGDRDAHGPIGSGSIDFTDFMKAIKSIGYSKLFCLEILHNHGSDVVDYYKTLKRLYDEFGD